MIKKLKVLFAFILFFFMLPIVAGQLPLPNNQKYEFFNEKDKQLVLASTEVIQDEVNVATDVSPAMDTYDILFVFTHSHETYKPFVESKEGVISVYDDQTNLYSMKDRMKDYFRLNGLVASSLDVDVMNVVEQKGLKFSQSYDAARPYIIDELKKKEYDLILDIHRDSLTGDKTTVKHQDVSFAQVVFVIGAENPNHQINRSYAKSISDSLNEMVPNISKGIIEKEGSGVDGVYNQDLAENFILIEIGGIDNTEDEVYRTVSVLAQAIHNVLSQQAPGE